MNIQTFYSHLNGMEHIEIHYPGLWKTILDSVAAIDANKVRIKSSKEKTMFGRMLISPGHLNKALKAELHNRGWSKPERVNFLYSDDAATNRRLLNMQYEDQCKTARLEGIKTVPGFTEADFRYKRVALEVQFGKYSFVQYDIFAKHAANYMADLIDVGIELVPMHSMYENMSSGPSYYERNLNEILRQGRIFPPVPLVLAGIAE